MKYVFIINPKAGSRDCSDTIVKTIKTVSQRRNLDCEIYITKAAGDGSAFVKAYPTADLDHLCCFVACGGDGTLGEVVEGAVGKQNCAVGVLPFGTGNDFIRSFEGKESFINMFNMLDGTLQPIDLLKCGERYSINLCNIGFDAKVAKNMSLFRRVAFLKGPLAYNASVLYSLKDDMYLDATIRFDDGESYHQPFLLMSAANGTSYGGGFYAAPNALINDGLLEFCAIKKIPLYKIASFIGVYKKGQHLDNPKVRRHLIYRRCKSVTISSAKPFAICIDGEVYTDTSIEITVHPGALTFLIPRGCTLHQIATAESELIPI